MTDEQRRDPAPHRFGPGDVNDTTSAGEGSASDEPESSERQRARPAASSERQRARPAAWIDSHCHLYEERIPGGVQGAIDEAGDAGVAAMVTIGCDRATSLAGLDLSTRFAPIHATVGLHPHEARHGVDTVRDLFARPDVAAVGECGLDYYYEHSPRAAQRQAFAEQIAVANERQLPLVVHTRDAWDETFEILDAEGVPARTVIHCFTGGVDELWASVERGTFVSFSGIVTFAKSTKIQDAACQCPLERLLVETDSPYLAPSPNRGKANTPAWVAIVGDFIAGLRHVPVEVIRDATHSAALRAFPLVGSRPTDHPSGDPTEH